jgi:hypothetical protein
VSTCELQKAAEALQNLTGWGGSCCALKDVQASVHRKDAEQTARDAVRNNIRVFVSVVHLSVT